MNQDSTQIVQDQPKKADFTAISGQQDINEHKDIAALGYVWVLSVFVFLFKHQSPFVRFHAQQGMVLFALSSIFWFVPVVGKLLTLVVLALAVIGFMSAAQGQWRELPFIYALSSGNFHGLRASWSSFIQSITHLFHRTKRSTGNLTPDSAELPGTRNNPPPAPPL